MVKISVYFVDRDSLIITSEPKVIKGGEFFNAKRKEEGLEPVKLVIVDLVDSGGDEGKMSSTLIRQMLNKKCPEELKTKIDGVWEEICAHFAVDDIVKNIW